MTRHLRLDDLLVICEEVPGRPAEQIAAESRLELGGLAKAPQSLHENRRRFTPAAWDNRDNERASTRSGR